MEKYKFVKGKQKNYVCVLESEKVGLKLNIQKMKIMASGPITSWEIDGPLPSCFILQILLPSSYGKQKANGPSSVTASRLSRGVDLACQEGKISGRLI